MDRKMIVEHLEELKNKLNPHNREELALIAVLSSVQGAVLSGNIIELMKYTTQHSKDFLSGFS